MRLYLSSFRLGNATDRLIALLGDNKTAAIIVNSGDFRTKSERKKNLEDEQKALASIGLDATELDLRDYFGRQAELAEKLKEFSLLWIRGGNVFLLRRAMKQSGFDIIIKDMLAEDALVYAGYSAAACVLAPTLKGFSIVDDPNIIADGYDQAVPWDGLSILNYSIEPHYKSDHPESTDVDKEIAYLEANNIPYRTLRDGEVLVIDGDKDEVIV